MFEKYVVTSAMHDNDAQVAPAECHPNTRVVLLRKLENWGLGLEDVYDRKTVLWVHGSAGIGKTAIGKSLARLLENIESPVASFFCFSTDGQRNTIRNMVSTLAYQIALAVPETQPFIIDAVRRERKIFRRSPQTQFLHLVMNPLLQLPLPPSQLPPHVLILIDGLDEISRESKERRVILDIIRSSLLTLPGRVRFLIASRPEHDIETAFNHPDFTPHLFHLDLRLDLSSHDDIHKFLQDRFATLRAEHRLKSHLQSWPPQEAITTILYRSSNHFIYAATVMKYIEAEHTDPRTRLDDILSLTSTSSAQNPYADLDAVFQQVLVNVRTDRELVLTILRLSLASQTVENLDLRRFMGSTKFIESLLCLPEGGVSLALMDLPSLLKISSSVEFLHKTIEEYLLDRSRSKGFYVDIEPAWPLMVTQIHKFLDELFLKGYVAIVQQYSVYLIRVWIHYIGRPMTL